MKKSVFSLLNLVLAALIVGIFCSLMIFSLKEMTELIEEKFYTFSKKYLLLMIFFPVVGLLLIHYIRRIVFKGKENRGIREVTSTLLSPDPQLPSDKIPSHFINGFLTVVFGGSTGIEVSSVVAGSSAGSVYGKKVRGINKYKRELICCGAATAITVLFNSPFAGIFFAYEVMYKKISWSFFITTAVAAFVGLGFNYLVGIEPLFHVDIQKWHYHAIPWFILLGVISGLNSVYLTKMVLWLKSLINKINQRIWRVLIGGLLVGVAICFLPAIYGEGYSSIQSMLTNPLNHTSVFMLIIQFVLILLIKPVCTSLTLAAGGDGGVFAPSLFIGAFLGGLIAYILNHFFQANVIPVNFMIVGMASVLCASIHAPITSIFLVCGVTGNYVLVFPIIIGCTIARITSHFIYPFTVYNAPVK